MLPGVVVARPDRTAADRRLGNSVGAIGWLLGVALRPRGPSPAAGCALARAPFPVTLRPYGGLPGVPSPEARLGSG
jgi:hypothetical protein